MSMVTIIRNAKVYQPEYAGIKDILILGSKIAAVGEKLKAYISMYVQQKTNFRNEQEYAGYDYEL